jgi:hypothetical protein
MHPARYLSSAGHLASVRRPAEEIHHTCIPGVAQATRNRYSNHRFEAGPSKKAGCTDLDGTVDVIIGVVIRQGPLHAEALASGRPKPSTPTCGHRPRPSHGSGRACTTSIVALPARLGNALHATAPRPISGERGGWVNTQPEDGADGSANLARRSRNQLRCPRSHRRKSR